MQQFPQTIRPEQTYGHALAAEGRAGGAILARYMSGDCEGAWGELVRLGERVREPAVLPDAIMVARETMRRCRANLQTLIYRLEQAGYQLRNPEVSLVASDPDVLQRIERLEQHVGPLPLSLCAWYEIVGSVDLSGGFSDDMAETPDPLVMLPAGFVLEYDAQKWWHERYKLLVAPNLDQKEQSGGGGMPYAISLPNPGADAVVEEEWHKTTFVNYLRTCFRWGGRPGLALGRKGRPEDHPGVRELAAGLLPI